MNKKILIITYKFPPMGGVSTRRWVKLSKALSNKGYQVFIIAVEYPYEDSISWSNELTDNIAIHRFKSIFPSWILKNHQRKFPKQLARVVNFFLRKVFFYLDEAQYDTKRIVCLAKELIEKHSIINVVATGHPVSLNYAASIIKYDLPQINLIQDFRDNWNDLPSYSFPKGLMSLRKKSLSMSMETLAVTYSDNVINVTADLTEVMRRRHNFLDPNKFLTVYNFFDRDDYDTELSEGSDKLVIRYFGSLYNNRIGAIYLLLDALISLNDKFLLANLKIEIYSNFSADKLSKKYHCFIGKNIFFNELVAPSIVPNLISDSFCCLSINSVGAEYAFGTKIFEYMALRKMILHISNGGELYDLLVESNQLVSIYDIANAKAALSALKDRYMNSSNLLNNPERFEGFSLNNATQQIEGLLK